MKKNNYIIIIIIVISTIIVTLSFPQLKSMSTMYIHSFFQKRSSIMERNNFDLDIPGGIQTSEKDWYPFVMTFNDENIHSVINEDIDLTILYNFGAFKNARSLLYQRDSDYFSSFYGAYVIESKDKSRKYGFKDNEIVLEEIEKIAAHDLETLVLKGLGHTNPEVIFKSIGQPKKTNYLDSPDWIVVDAVIDSPSPLHKKKKNHLSYIQYGTPPRDYTGEDFFPIQLAGRVYGRYFEDLDVSIFLYIIATDFEVVDRTDREILRESRIIRD